MNEKLRWRIVTFFNYWRQRHSFIRDLDFSKHHHEANVLIWASLDALSNLWVKNIGKDEFRRKSKRLIFDEFLARYGGDIFQIVSLPDVWIRIDREETMGRNRELNVPQDVLQFLGGIGDRQTPTFFDEHQLRQISHDLSLSEIISAIFSKHPEVDCKKLKDWLVLSRYGAIAYKEMRSAYIHEGRSGKNSHGFKLSKSAVNPTYLSGIYTTPPAIGFDVEFMVNILEDCINEFESHALSLQRDPVPEE